ncbi:MAG: tRNA lysidine(34) synthetase TilS, partial [Immundisolibacteraceae bacterium]|nr:tRNA lysidine(34) synthetase TilS [Immundisolibacteraceae bacterium]
ADLLAIHVDHNLSPQSAQWACHFQQIAQQWQVAYVCCQVEPGLLAGGNLEHRAREIRYQLIADQLGDDDLLLTAHHQRDQAETLLLQLFRGSGVRGTAAMAMQSNLSIGSSKPTLLRPLLTLSQQDLKEYADHHKLQWVEDPSNQQQVQDRNFLRNQVMPALRQRWPALDNTLARHARHQAEAGELLDELALLDMAVLDSSKPGLDRSGLLELSVSRRHNLLRFWLRQQGHLMPSEKQLLALDSSVLESRSDRSPQFTWGNSVITCYRDRLAVAWQRPIQIPTQMPDWLLPESYDCAALGYRLTAIKTRHGLRICWPEDKPLQVCFRQGGETLVVNGHRRKLKKLLQQWGVPPVEREFLPLLSADGEIVAIPGYAVADSVTGIDDQPGWQLSWAATGLEPEPDLNPDPNFDPDPDPEQGPSK